jgi:PBSX family phage terminase large subunit
LDFKKTAKQREAIPVLASKKYAALYGGSRSGKTFIIVYALIVRAAKVKSRHVIVRRTFSSVKRSIFLDTLPKVLQICFPELQVKWNKTDFYITLPNGSEIWLAGLDDSRVEKILGMEFSTIYFNEASELDYAPMQVVISRLAQKNDLKKRIWFDFNPPTKTHWSYWLFIKHLNPIDDEPLENPNDYGYLLINPKDNLENIDEEYLKILERMPQRDRERFLEGKFSDNSDGNCYYSFVRDKHVKEFSNNVMGGVFIGTDFNVQPMTSVVIRVVNNVYCVIDEIYLENSDTYKLADELLKRGYRGTLIPDSTGKNRKTSGKSDHEILKEAGFRIPSVRNPFVTDRVNNVNRLFTANRIIINPKCKKLIADLEKVVWKKNKIDAGADGMLGHITDALGYALWHLDPIGMKTSKINIGSYR